MKYMKKAKLVVAIALATALPTGVAFAQETASSINGTIVDSQGNVLSGATVTVIHEPTGQKKVLTTNDSGRYSARGLRVGGPYSIDVNYDGYSEAEEDDVYVKLGEDRSINAVLVKDAIALDTVKAVGVAVQSATFNPSNMGAGSSFSEEQLTNLPTVDRDIQSFLRLDSRINIRDNARGISVSGVNNRFNNISIDGVGIGDPFGLEAGGSPGLSQPFSLDTVEQLNVQLSPYDVTLGNFTGANINAVTKSGTNEFHGRFSVFYADEDLQRDDEDPYTNEVYSLSVGGPIVKDKLFFFLAYEKEERTEQANGSNVNVAEAQAVADVANSVWGFNPGTLSAPGQSITQEESVVLKLDWNINDYHRASFKYQQNEDIDPRFADFGGGEISFNSHWFENLYENKSYNVNLYSDWTSNFSTEIRVSNSEFNKDPGVSLRMPEVRVNVDSGSVYMGTEQSRHANELNVNTDNFYAAGEYFMGDHTLTFGVDYKKQDVHNIYMRHALGTYTFDSVDDFANGIHDYYQVTLGVDPSNPYPAADWSWSNTAFFIQDNWMVNDRLTVQYGLRFDDPSVGKKPRFNQDFFDAYGFANNNVVSTGVVQPRFGFNYDLSDERYMQLRGGVGVFSGGMPNVWLSNSYTNTGGDTVNYSSRSSDNHGVIFTIDPDNQPTFAGYARQNVDVLDPDFEMPTVIKSNLALDVELPWWGLIASTELEYIKSRNEIHYKHLNLGDPTGTLPDGRLSYYEDPMNPGDRSNTDRFNSNSSFNDVHYLTNASGSVTKRATFSLELPQSEHWHAKASYTFTDAEAVSNGSSSTAGSNWGYNPAINPNEPLLGRSSYEIQNAFTMTVNYQNMFFGDTITNIGVIWISRDSEPFTYRYNNDANGDGRNTNDLVYVPMPDEYVMTDEDDRAAFEALLASSGLDQYRGQIAPKNGFNMPRINQFDINVSQELPAWGPVRASLFFNIKNLGNLINKDWGQVYTGYYKGESPFGLDSIQADGTHVIDWGRQFPVRPRPDSEWRAQLGFRLDW